MILEIKKLTEPFQKFSYDLVACNIKLLEKGIDYPFIVFNDRAKLFLSVLSERVPWLLKTEKALQSFKKRIDRIEEIRGLFYKIREARNRTPSGYITDILIIIPDSNRKIEYQIYDAFGELLRTTNSLLFDLHVLKQKGRKLEEIVPKGFRRYE
jgi:hypothetical protein